jgi:glucosyl-dolichyl phosphate glucuronosyltransferase
MITVIVCTYNRCTSLAKTLDSISESILPESQGWEVLVVDNNSNDRTRQVTQEFCQRYPARFRYFFEPRAGKSNALNAGVEQARGDILVFTDDDVTVDPAWLENLTAGLRSGEWAGAGGRIIPEWPCPPPSWIPMHQRYGMAPLVQFDLGPQAGPLTEPPFGANMAFRREVFQKYGTFRTDLGPRPNGETCKSEDIEFGQRMLANGESLRYEPTAIVHHAVPENRLQKDYFLKWWLDKTRSDIRANGGTREARWSIGRVPVYLVRRLGFWTARWMLTVDPAKRFACKLSVWCVIVTIIESRRQSTERQLAISRKNNTH